MERERGMNEKGVKRKVRSGIFSDACVIKEIDAGYEAYGEVEIEEIKGFSVLKTCRVWDCHKKLNVRRIINGPISSMSVLISCLIWSSISRLLKSFQRS